MRWAILPFGLSRGGPAQQRKFAAEFIKHRGEAGDGGLFGVRNIVAAAIAGDDEVDGTIVKMEPAVRQSGDLGAHQ